MHEFAASARDYCAWCESSKEKSAHGAFSHLIRLVELIRHVPQGPGGDLDPPAQDADRWKDVFRGFGEIPVQYYQSQFDPLNLGQVEMQVGDVHDDLADIWSDLIKGLAVYDQGDVAAAAFQWRFTFNSHWGRHATGAIYALHCWLADNGEDE